MLKSNPNIKFFWKWYKVQGKTYRFNSPAKAKEFMKKKIEYFIKRKFDKLPSGYVIYPRKAYDTE